MAPGPLSVLRSRGSSEDLIHGVAEHRSLAPAMSFHCVLLSPRGRRAGLARDRARLCVLVLREKKLREPGRESAGLG